MTYKLWALETIIDIKHQKWWLRWKQNIKLRGYIKRHKTGFTDILSQNVPQKFNKGRGWTQFCQAWKWAFNNPKSLEYRMWATREVRSQKESRLNPGYVTNRSVTLPTFPLTKSRAIITNSHGFWENEGNVCDTLDIFRCLINVSSLSPFLRNHVAGMSSN